MRSVPLQHIAELGNDAPQLTFMTADADMSAMPSANRQFSQHYPTRGHEHAHTQSLTQRGRAGAGGAGAGVGVGSSVSAGVSAGVGASTAGAGSSVSNVVPFSPDRLSIGGASIAAVRDLNASSFVANLDDSHVVSLDMLDGAGNCFEDLDSDTAPQSDESDDTLHQEQHLKRGNSKCDQNEKTHRVAVAVAETALSASQGCSWQTYV